MRLRALTPALTLVATVALSGAVYHHESIVAQHDLSVEDANGKTLVHLAQLPALDLDNLDGNNKMKLPAIAPGTFRLLVFLSSGDCGDCLTIVDQVNTLAAIRSSSLQVDAIFIRSSVNEANQVLATIKPRFFRAFSDDDGSVVKTVNLPLKTPLVVLVDSSYVVKVAEGATNNGAVQADFISLISRMTEPVT